MTYQYTPSGWSAQLALINLQLGTTFTTAQYSQAAANVIVNAAEINQETVRQAQAAFNNLVNLRRLIYTTYTADPAVAVITSWLGGFTGRWPDDITSIPSVP